MQDPSGDLDSVSNNFVTRLVLLHDSRALDLLDFQSFPQICQKALKVANGNPNLTLVSNEVPLPGPGEVLVKINSVSLNYKDGETIEGQFKHHKAIEMHKTIVPCGDAAGEIWAVGDGVMRWKKGDRVLSTPYPTYKTGKITQKMLSSGISGTGKGKITHYCRHSQLLG